MKILNSKKGQNAMSLFAILIIILVFDLGIIYFTGSVGYKVNTVSKSLSTTGLHDAINESCDKGHYIDLRNGNTLTLLQVGLTNTVNTQFVCDTYKNEGFGINLLTGITEIPILGGIIVILTIAFIVGVAILILHGNG